MANRVVSLTPIALQRDSRTLKHAASLARFGYESTVVEGESSASLADSLPFALVTAMESAAAEPSAAEAKQRPPGTEDVSPPSRLVALVDPLATPLRRERARWSAARRFLGDFWRINRRTFAALPDADVYWLHSYWQFPAVFWKCRRSGATIVYDAHDSYRDLPRIELPLVPAILALVERACVRRAAALSTVSDGVAARLRSRFGRDFAVVRNCHDSRLDRPAATDLRTLLGLSSEDVLVVSLGQNRQGMALDEATAALTGMERGVHLAFLGAGYEREGGSVPAGRSHIHFVAPVGPNEVTDFIAPADAAAVLRKPMSVNFTHALPNGFFHAIAAGLPILYPPLAEIRALSQRFGLGPPIDPSDPKSIAAGIGTLLADSSRLARYRENVERARRELSWEGEEPKLAGIARAALAQRERGTR